MNLKVGDRFMLENLDGDMEGYNGQVWVIASSNQSKDDKTNPVYLGGDQVLISEEISQGHHFMYFPIDLLKNKLAEFPEDGEDNES